MKRARYLAALAALGASLGFAGLGRAGPPVTTVTAGTTNLAISGDPGRRSIWAGNIGEGFADSVEQLGAVAGAGPGMIMLGSSSTHDIALGGISYGRMIGQTCAIDSWLRGNWQWRLELLGGAQFYPNAQYIVGLTPHLRYNFATGTRWIPFVDAGVGVTATEIGPPDLGGWFQFNVQAGAGVNYFLHENTALSLEYRFFHLSSARISTPNTGVDTSLFLLGVNWYF